MDNKPPKKLKKKAAQFTFRLDREMRRFIVERAVAQRRSLGDYLCIVLEDHKNNILNSSNTTATS